MKSLSSVGLGLSLVFGCLLLAFVAELYYLLWWKKRLNIRKIEEDDYRSSSPKGEFFYMFCWKKPCSLSSTTALNPQDFCSSMRIRETHVESEDQESMGQTNLNGNKDFLLKSSSSSSLPFGEDGVESEFMRRFLFTIKEETKEDLESENGGNSKKGSRKSTRSLSDLLFTVETPFLTPLSSSPPFLTPPLTPSSFNPLYESLTDAEFNKIRSSPPPKFKFLQDAEEKLYKRKLIEEAEAEAELKRVQNIDDESVQEIGINENEEEEEEEDGSFITIIVAKNKEEKELNQCQNLPQYHSSSCSQVLPLASSPSSFKNISYI